MSRSMAASHALSGESGRDIRRACSAAAPSDVTGSKRRSNTSASHARRRSTASCASMASTRRARAAGIGRAGRRTEHPGCFVLELAHAVLHASAQARLRRARVQRADAAFERHAAGPREHLVRGGQRGRFDRQRGTALAGIAWRKRASTRCAGAAVLNCWRVRVTRFASAIAGAPTSPVANRRSRCSRRALRAVAEPTCAAFWSQSATR